MQRILPEEWRPIGVDSLEEAADDAVRAVSNTLVVAGPGAGKTELLAQRACYLLQTSQCMAPRRILAIAFKRDAAKNLDERVRRRCGDQASRFDSMTLDAFAKSLVDRFRDAIPSEWRPHYDYKIVLRPPANQEIRHWLGRVPLPRGCKRPNFIEWRNDEVKAFFDRCVHGHCLPYRRTVVPALEAHLGRLWWRQQLDLPLDSPSLSFPMLNRLAALILRRNPLLSQALRQTYAFVFLDEFQDTTASQYDLIRAGFEDSTALLTAVGDPKQRIMVWAGALKEVLPTFVKDFDATALYLIRNYRSAPKLVEMQHAIATAIEPESPRAHATKSRDAEGTCCILEFSSPDEEAQTIVELIRKGIDVHGLRPRDFCVLVRQKTSEMIPSLESAMRDVGLSIRDESQLQDLLAEPLTELLLAILRLATTRRDPEAWRNLTSGIADLNGRQSRRQTKHFLEREAKQLMDAAQKFLRTQPDHASLESLLRSLTEQLGVAALKSTFHQYVQGTFLDDKISELASILEEAEQEMGDFRHSIDWIIGNDIVPAMTIHKSKGLEFHTVIFLGLEDSSWWSFRTQAEEDKRSFFVAFSRAIQRVYFTFSDQRLDARYGMRRQQRSDIADLYSVLRRAGVATHNMRGRDHK